MKIILVVYVSLICFLCICAMVINPEYSYRQSADQIIAIEILKNPEVRTDAPMHVLKTLDPSEFQMVLDGLDSIQAHYKNGDPFYGFGMYVIRITYQNGEIDIIGNYNTGYITVDGQLHQERFYFKREPYYDLISEILGEEVTDFIYG